jgi:hypothetical protein
MSKKLTVILLLLPFMAIFKVHASATAHDFEPCQKIAVKSLTYCLASESALNSGRVNNEQCWTSSKKDYDLCLVKIVNSYDPREHHKRKAAQQLAEQELRTQEVKSKNP